MCAGRGAVLLFLCVCAHGTLLQTPSRCVSALAASSVVAPNGQIVSHPDARWLPPRSNIKPRAVSYLQARAHNFGVIGASTQLSQVPEKRPLCNSSHYKEVVVFLHNTAVLHTRPICYNTCTHCVCVSWLSAADVGGLACGL